jgi:hypothetical protein
VIVKFINTDGMAFIGPGSEWFWTAISGVVLAVTFLAILNQLRLARSEGAIKQLTAFEREWASERMLRLRLLLLLAIRDGADKTVVPDGPARSIADFWEKIGGLVRAGHINRRLLWNGNGVQSQLWWPVLVPWVLKQRAAEDNQRVYEHFEWIAGVMDETDRHEGLPAVAGGSIANDIAGAITSIQDRLRVEEALRTVIVASRDAFPTAPPATAATSKG